MSDLDPIVGTYAVVLGLVVWLGVALRRALADVHAKTTPEALQAAMEDDR